MIPLAMTRQIERAHHRFIARVLHDQAFAQRMASHVQHARLAHALPAAPGHVLELGCGPGKYVAMLHGLKFTVTGIDPHSFASWDMLRRETGTQLRDGVYAEHLPFPDAHFDHVVCLGTLLYVNDPERSLAEMRRVIKPGGRLVVRTVNRRNLYTRRTGQVIDPASKNLYSMSELVTTVERHGFRVTDSLAYGLLLPWCRNLWWYAISVVLPLWVQDGLSALTPHAARWNNTVFATALQSVPGGASHA